MELKLASGERSEAPTCVLIVPFMELKLFIFLVVVLNDAS